MNKIKFSHNNKGVAAIEMAIVLPILLLIIAAVIEFGLYFFKSQIAARTVSTAAISLQMNPEDSNIQTTAQNNGLTIMDFNTLPNFVCAKAYATSAAAKAGQCGAGEWLTSNPTSVVPYYISVRAFAVHTPLTPLRAISGAFPPDINENIIVQVGAANTNRGNAKLGVDRDPYQTSATSTISGTFTVPENVTSIKATLVGGGQSGAGTATASPTPSGGESGHVLIVTFKNLTPGQSISYSVGGGGDGASAGNSPQNGANTSFNGIIVGGGGNSNIIVSSTPSSGALATYTGISGISSFRGNPGETIRDDANYTLRYYLGGRGGNTPLGFGSGGSSNNSNNYTYASNGSGYGSGGAGFTPQNGPFPAVRRGNGAPGVILLEW